ncbi:DNA-methyltransferase [Bacillus altitudinis]|uniref:DNA-methyltransferase n=1 Tax=Bacillus altitudinis TaxID=293387 RepID=UPI0022814DF9|nr:site-specific DNA-methyltransferase [Bacillus altitudinis]MCY7439404.1 site-specific DNA-methyltransferase [Bacillus altitudinis]MEC1142442.1 site-specific DNA-methyltransferase [Bacillus altitudinis]
MSKEVLGGIELNRIYHMDCLEGMRMIPDSSVDLIIADPPYNKKVSSWDNYRLEDYLKFIAKSVEEYKRILSPKGSVFIYNQQPMASYMFQLLYEKLNFVDEIIWYYKNGGGNAKKKPKNAHQLLYWFSKTEEYIKNFDEVRQSYSGTREIYKHNVDKNPAKAWSPNTKGAMPTNVWEVSVVRQTQATKLAKLGVQKPLELGDKIIKMASNHSSKVVIPFVGSGSECVNCASLSRDFVGFELNKEYIEIANKRISNNSPSIRNTTQ